MRSALGNECVLYIVGNKSDLEKDRHVSVQEAEEYAASVGADHFFASAKLNKGVTEIFLDISQSMFRLNFFNCILKLYELRKYKFIDEYFKFVCIGSYGN